MENYAKYFRIRKVGTSTYYVVIRRGTPYYKSISPDFRSAPEAYAWVKKYWEDLIFEEVVLK